MSFCYDHPRPALTVDCVVFGLDEGDLKVLLVQRTHEPFRHRFALPGGSVRMEESAERAARRKLEEETGVRDVYLEQLYTFSAVDRDPHERTVSIAYYALVKMTDHMVRESTDGAAWFSVSDARDLAFDHDQIVQTACERLRGKLRYQPIGFELLPEKFKLSQLQRLYEVVLGTPLDKRNFRKKILSMNLLRPLNEVEQGVAHRAARLYRFDSRRYQELRRRGYLFEL